MDHYYKSVFLSLLLLSLLFRASFTEDEVRCLQELKNSLTDPQGRLGSWVFSNYSNGFICNFTGVSCWDDRENRLIGLNLHDFALTGNIPNSLQLCHSLQSLQLSGNSLFGQIPPQICDWLPYLTNLDLSNNDLTGQIPEDLTNCSYLNTLILDGNRLSGSIPYQISSLMRLRRFFVANNDLSGRVPSFNYPLEVDYRGNNGLCGGSMGRCARLSRRDLVIIVVAGVLGAATSLLCGLCWLRVCRKRCLSFWPPKRNLSSVDTCHDEMGALW